MAFKLYSMPWMATSPSSSVTSPMSKTFGSSFSRVICSMVSVLITSLALASLLYTTLLPPSPSLEAACEALVNFQMSLIFFNNNGVWKEFVTGSKRRRRSPTADCGISELLLEGPKIS